jgi:hypothetical protein
MTTEEAIKTLKENMCAQCAYGSDMENCDISYCDNRDAIKALEQEPCDDAISREEALKEMQNYYDDCAKTSEYTRLGFETAMNVVKELPPVTPQPKTGYWISWYEIIEEEWGTEHNPHCKCSECSTEVDPHTSKFIKCCPVCGAKMLGYRKREEDHE